LAARRTLLTNGPVPVLNVELLASLRSGPLADETDLSAAEGLFDLVEHELIAYGTSGSDLTDQQSIILIRTLEAVTKRRHPDQSPIPQLQHLSQLLDSKWRQPQRRLGSSTSPRRRLVRPSP
jgi:hypothetical protein